MKNVFSKMNYTEILTSIKNFTEYLNSVDSNVGKIENFDFSLNIINELEKLQKKSRNMINHIKKTEEKIKDNEQIKRLRDTVEGNMTIEVNKKHKMEI